MKKYAELILLIFLLLSPTVVAQERIVIRWFLWLQLNEEGIAAQKAVADAFNAQQDEIELIPEGVDNEAYEAFLSLLESGRLADILGPFSIDFRAGFPDEWLDLDPFITASNYDLSDYDPAVLNYYHIEGRGQIAIPLSIFPAFLIYNKALFDEAGVPYPPRTYGEVYIDWNGQEREWNMETLREVAMLLSRDAKGNNPTMEGFDPQNIVQYGFVNQYTDMRERDTLFGAGSFLDDEDNAVIPENWRAAENWYHQGIWEDYFYPNYEMQNSEYLNHANWFGSGHVAMAVVHSWYLGWSTSDLEAEFDFAPLPSYQGQVSAAMHEGNFVIWRGTEHPEEAFTVLSYLLSEQAEELNRIYLGMPARTSLQNRYIENYIADLSEEYPASDWASLNWDVVLDSIQYSVNPSDFGEIPNRYNAILRYHEYMHFVDGNADADVDAELDLLENDLQAIFDNGR